MGNLDELSQALRALAALLRSGLSIRLALKLWQVEAPTALRLHLQRLGRRLSLGEVAERAARSLTDGFGEDAERLSALIALHSRTGADLSEMLEGLADAIERRGAAEEAAHSACAGAALSARIVAALPLAVIPLTPLSRAPLLDPLGLVSLVAGIGLAALGLWWMRRLVPRAEVLQDPVADLAELVASALRGGVGLNTALSVASRHAPAALRPALAQADRRARLGARWTEALARSSDEGLRSLGAALARVQGKGVSIADAFYALAEARRAQRARQLDAATKRAPVLMVMPLVLCILPSFVILGLGPFLRGLWFSS